MTVAAHDASSTKLRTRWTERVAAGRLLPCALLPVLPVVLPPLVPPFAVAALSEVTPTSARPSGPTVGLLQLGLLLLHVELLQLLLLLHHPSRSEPVPARMSRLAPFW